MQMKPSLTLLCMFLFLLTLLSGCSGGVIGVPEPRASSPDSRAAGKKLIASYGCGSCHSIPGVPGADSMAGPPLACFYERTYIAGKLPNTWDNLIQWIQHPQEVEPGTAMPDLGVGKEDAYNIASYLYDEPTEFRLDRPLEKRCEWQ
jgi:cytochrome c2